MSDFLELDVSWSSKKRVQNSLHQESSKFGQVEDNKSGFIQNNLNLIYLLYIYIYIYLIGVSHQNLCVLTIVSIIDLDAVPPCSF